MTLTIVPEIFIPQLYVFVSRAKFEYLVGTFGHLRRLNYSFISCLNNSPARMYDRI
jgi:hypothetical protein